MPGAGTPQIRWGHNTGGGCGDGCLEIAILPRVRDSLMRDVYWAKNGQTGPNHAEKPLSEAGNGDFKPLCPTGPKLLTLEFFGDRVKNCLGSLVGGGKPACLGVRMLYMSFTPL